MIVFIVLTMLFVFRDPFNISEKILAFLRLHFFIFTKEPKLLYYLTLYTGTIVFKIISIIFLAILIKGKNVSFQGTVLFNGKLPAFSGVWLPSYLVLCAAICMMNAANPFVPNIPFNSVFLEAKVIGNTVVIFAILFIAPFVEEIIFRGFLYPAFNKHVGVIPSIIFTSLLFTLAHYPQIKGEYTFMLALFVLSVIITYARARTGSTFFAVIMHFIYNAVCVVLGFIVYFILRY